MKIAIDVSGALGSPSGMRVYIEQLIRALARVDRENHYFCYAAYWRDYRNRSSAFPIPNQPNFHPLYIHRPERVINFAEERLGISVHERWLKRQAIDLFHGPANLLPCLREIPGVITLHHVGGPLDVNRATDRFYYYERTQRSLIRSSEVISISEFTRGEAISKLGVPPEKIHVVWEGADVELFPRATDPEIGRTKVGRPYILFVSAINKRKNLARLIEAFYHLKQTRQIPHALVFVGKKDHSFGELQNLIAQRNLQSEVLFYEDLDPQTLATLYRGCDVFVYPSLLEGFGLPLLEAMGCQAPIATARSSALPEIAGDAALFFDGQNVQDMARTIDLILTDTSLRKDLILKGLQRVQRFSWDETARQTIAVYRKALKQ